MIPTHLQGVEKINAPFVFNITALTDVSPSDLNHLLFQSVSLTLTLHHEGREINGYVQQLTLGDPDVRGLMHCELKITPWFEFLKQSSHCRHFQNLSVPEIFKAVCAKYKFAEFDLSDLTKTYLPLNYCVQLNETDFDFLTRILFDAGIFYTFRMMDKGCVMVLGDQSALLPKLVGSFEVVADKAGQAHITAWQPQQQLHTLGSSARDYDYTTPRDQLLATAGQTLESAPTLPLEKFHYPGNYQDGEVGQQKIAQHQAVQSWQANIIDGKSNAVNLASGEFLSVIDSDDSTQNGEYLLLEIHHEAKDFTQLSSGSNAGEATESFYANQFKALPQSVPFVSILPHPQPQPLSRQGRGEQEIASTTPFPAGREERNLASASAFGAGREAVSVLPAVVVGPKQDALHTDALGRVKVQFKWDQLSDYNEESSIWVRVKQEAASGLSSQWIPRVGDEVLVGFENDNVNRPIILSALYNANQTEPFALPANQNTSAITTHILGSRARSVADPGCGHQVIFDDTPGAENFVFKTENLHQRDILKTDTYLAKGGQATTVNGDILVHINGHATINASNAVFSAGGSSVKLDGGLFANIGGGIGKVLLQTPTVGSVKPLARIGDHHVCPKVTNNTPHVGGPILTGSAIFKADAIPVARVGDLAQCHVGGPDVIAQGIPGIIVGGRLVARMGDACAHGGVVTVGSPNVLAAPSVPVPTVGHTLTPLYAEQPQGKHWIQAQYLDAAGKGLKDFPYTIIHENGRTVKGTLDSEGKTQKVTGLPEGTAKIAFGDQKQLEQKAQQDRDLLETKLKQILAKAQAQAKKDNAQLAAHEHWYRYWAETKSALDGFAAGLESLLQSAKTIGKEVVELMIVPGQAATQGYHSVKNLIQTAQTLYDDEKTRAILLQFVKAYYQIASPQQIAHFSGAFVGMALPSVILALFTEGSSAIAESTLGGDAVEPVVSSFQTTAKGLSKVLEQLKRCKQLEDVPVDNNYKVVDIEDIKATQVGNIKAVRVKPGTNGKVAIIGRSMGGKPDELGVKDFNQALQNKGYNTEIFDDKIIPTSAQAEFERKTANGNWLNDDELIKTKMFLANKQWATKIKQEGYTILDTGNPNNKGLSPFYEVEKQILFGGHDE